MAAFLTVLGSVLHLYERTEMGRVVVAAHTLFFFFTVAIGCQGHFSGHSYLTGLFGCLSGLLDVWPISNGGVMQILFGIFFISNLYFGGRKRLFEVHRILKRPHSIQTSFVLSKSKPVCTTVPLNPLAREVTRAGTHTHLGSTGSRQPLGRRGGLTSLCFLATSMACFTSGGSCMME